MAIAYAERKRIHVWSDTTSTKGLAAFYLREHQVHPQPDAAFSIPFPRSLVKGQEHINTQEMRAVEQVLLHWGNKWRGTILIMHIDNKAVVHGLKNHTIRAGSMNLLWRCLLLATEYDLELEAQ